MESGQMQATARSLVEPSKGILAADESLGTIEKRFKGVGIPNTQRVERRPSES